MALRENFDSKLNELNEKVLELGKCAENAFIKSIHALREHDIESAIQIIDEDSYIDHLEEEINDYAILQIALEAPVAVDLRRITVAIKIASDLERVADYAVNIAKSVIRIGKMNESLPDTILKMFEITKEMLTLSFKAYIEEDVVLAKKIADMDDEVDQMYGETIQAFLQTANIENKDHINQITQLSFITRYIERIGDYATNISEGVFYVVKGIRYELNN